MSEQTTAPTERDEVAEDIRSLGITVVSGPPVDLSAPLAQHLRGLGYRKTRTISTVEELDSLVGDAVVLDRDGDCFQFDGQYWFVVGYGDSFAGHEIALPAIVLHEGVAS